MYTAELLDSDAWDTVLETYARCVDAAVALVGHDGRLIGRCHNPKPIWKLARAARPDWNAGCPFCLDPAGICTALADAERSGCVAVTVGMGGFAHSATPLFLEDEHLGTLLAGQVFDQYPELLLLERVAREFGLSGQELWRLARQRVPVSRATLETYGSLLGTLGQAYLQERHATILQRQLVASNERLRVSNQELQDANLQLDVNLTELQRSVSEKDILLNEVHHRVNNNLAVIASILRMQAEAFPDERVADALRVSQLRVESMALIHAHMYNSTDWRAVKFADYVRAMGGNLFQAYGIEPSGVQLRVEVGDLELGVDKAIPAGLILNELIMNALKHAFPAGRAGFLLIAGRLEHDRVELSVEDNGVGVLERLRRSLGMTIIKVLCRQLKGTFEPLNLDAGSSFRLSFPR